MQGSVKHAGKIFLACAQLHNFVIDLEGGVSTAGGEVGTEIGIDDDDDDIGFLPSDVGVAAIPGNSIMREILVERMSVMALVRPRYNINRNNNGA